MTKPSNKNSNKSCCNSMDSTQKCGYVFSRLIVFKSNIADAAEINRIIVALVAKGFLFILVEEKNKEINIVFENPNTLFVFEPMSDSEVTHKESLKMLSEYMDQVVPYPYKVIPEVYWCFNESILNGGNNYE